MSDLKVGDRVQWWETFKNTKETPRTMTGTVVSVRGRSLGIKGDGEGYHGGIWVRNTDVLTHLTDTDRVPENEPRSAHLAMPKQPTQGKCYCTCDACKYCEQLLEPTP